MGQQIIKQPNGLYAVFSSNTDTITVWDATEDELVEHFAEQAAEDARRAVRQKLRHVAADQPRKAYHQFAMTWTEALARDREKGGEVWRQVEDSL